MAAAGDTAPPADYHYLGKLGRTYQLAGGLRFYPAGELEADALVELERVFVAGLGPTRIREVRVHGGDLVVYLSRATTRDQAQRWVNAGVYADPETLPERSDEGFYLDDLLGLRVELVPAGGSGEAQSLGEVTDVVSTAGHDVLVVDGPEGRVLLPLQAPYVEFDAAGVRVVDPPEGLLD